MTGLWITFEGIGGAGKTTQVDLLYKYLKKRSINVELTKEPGGTPIGELLRNILVKNLDVKPERLSELFLFEADRHETIKKIVEPNIKEGRIIISDRGIDGSIAYQGFGRGLDLSIINYLTCLATLYRKPDLTILIDIDPEIAQKRIALRNNQMTDKFDLEEIEFQSKVRNGFLYSANEDPTRVKVVVGKKQIDQVHEDIIKIIEIFIKEAEYKG